MRMPKVVCLVAFVAVLVLAAGCSFLTKTLNDHEAGAQIVVQAATVRVLNERPAWTDRTIEITDGAVKALEGEGDAAVILDSLETYVLGEIRWEKLLPEEEVLVRTLIEATKADLKQYLADKGYEDPGEVKVQVAQVLAWINQAAKIQQARQALLLRRPNGDGLFWGAGGLPAIHAAGLG